MRFFFGFGEISLPLDGTLYSSGGWWMHASESKLYHLGKNRRYGDDRNIVTGDLITGIYDFHEGGCRFLINGEDFGIAHVFKWTDTIYPVFGIYTPGGTIQLLEEPDEFERLKSTITLRSV